MTTVFFSRRVVFKITDNLRYREKKLLSRYDLYVDLFKRFGLKVTDVVPLRNVYLLFTDSGRKILKKVEYSQENLQFINDALEYIRSGFNRIISFTKTHEGEIYTTWNGELYCVMDAVEGRECEFSNPLDVSTAITGVAELHKASEGYRCSYPDKILVGRAIDSFQRCSDELSFFKRLALLHEYKSDFDKLFLEYVDYYLKEVDRSMEMLKNSPYLKICSEEDKIAICHHDLAHHNILIKDDKAYFIDFDFAVVDLKVHDICNFINKAVKNFAFELERAQSIIEDYCTVNSLDRRELEVLKALLTFPEDFYSISKDYYARRKEWEEETFLDRLIRKVEYKEDREEFLSNFLTTVYQES
ncbi:CotS family spore coat protein [Clostridium thermarum]|uniref:CotS family spore coat protein n=1 Tax=Clostridium thermarum TaxID=1716543 RepID=UPI0011208DCE|nr:CotS family spore coat protein [Clostridium thermarum]